jgi:hypothetical protein
VNQGVFFFLVAGAFVVGFFVVMLPLVAFANRAIGARHDERARAIAPYLHAEGIRFAEDDVRVRSSWVAPLAFAVQWTRAEVRVTTRAVYLLQSTRMFGMRIAKPILAFPLRGAVLDPAVAASVSVGWLSTYPQESNGAATLTGGLGVQRCTLRVAVRDLRGFLAATA